jgi:aspartate aminotransferase
MHPSAFVLEHLNPNVVGLKPSATVAINDRSNALIRNGRDIVKLGLGQSPFPVPEPVVKALQKNAYQKDYLPVKGLYALREAVADHHRRAFDIDCDASDVLIGPGSKELMFLLQLAYNGDLVIPSPAWVSYAPQAQVMGRSISTIATTKKTNWHLTAEQLEGLCRDRQCSRLLVLNYPSNPTGRTLKESALVELADVARRNRALILSDEIYAKLHHLDDHRSIVPHYPEGTIFSGGLSKWCGAGGWRLGLFVFPPQLRWLLDAMAAVGTETFTATSAPIQYAAVEAFRENPEIETYLNNARRVLRALGGCLTDLLEACGAEVLRPEGAFYLFPDFSPFRERLATRGITTSAEFCERLLEDTGVAVLPGSDFGRPADELTIRISYVDFNGAAALQGAVDAPANLPLGATFARRHCPRCVDGIERIIDWLQR